MPEQDDHDRGTSDGASSADDGASPADDGASPADDGASPAEQWEERYSGAERIWSGEVNPSFAQVVAELPPGRALDLGCGEGADVAWLGRNGWHARGVDISATAVERARHAAADADLGEGSVHFIVADLADEAVDMALGGPFDLVSASYFHSTAELPRTAILRRAAGMLAPGGRLLIISHAAPPPWARDHARDHEGHHGHQGPHDFQDPQAELTDLDLDPAEWTVELAETRTRSAIGPDGEDAELVDGVLLIRSRS